MSSGPISQKLRTTAFALAAALGLWVCAQPAFAEVIYDEKTTSFDIGVKYGTPAEIWHGIERWGPSSTSGHVFGTTTGGLGWSYKKSQYPRGCTISAVKVKVSAHILLPGWGWEDRADPITRKFWNCIESTVNTHEQHHAEVWRQAGRDIDAHIRDLPDVMRCEAVESTINGIGNRINDVAHKRQNEFDEAEHRIDRLGLCWPQALPVKAMAPVPAKKAKELTVSQLAGQSKTPAETDQTSSVKLSANSMIHPTPTDHSGILLMLSIVVTLLGATSIVLAAAKAYSRKTGIDRDEVYESDAKGARSQSPTSDPAVSLDNLSAGAVRAKLGRRTS
jgi:predicted secreted Zn-dependent protease